MNTNGSTPRPVVSRRARSSGLLVALTASSLVATAPAFAASTFTLGVPSVLDVTSPIQVTVFLTSDRPEIAAVGVRLTFDAARATLFDVVPGAGAMANASFVYLDTVAPGELNVVVMDQTPTASTISMPADAEVLKLTFTRNDADPTPMTFGFNIAAPTPGPQAAAFPQNNYVIWVGTDIFLESATTFSATGPTVNPCLVDTTPPTIACPPAPATSFADGTCQAAVPDVAAGATVSDNCTTQASLAVTQIPAAGSLVAPGVYTITVTATDASSNSSSCSVGWTVENRAFIRGNVQNRIVHTLDIADLAELVNWLFRGAVLAFDCQAALDVNNDGGHNIVDVIALAQGMFRPAAYTIPGPSGIAGVADVDGGTIPSVLGCAQGENCP